MLSRPSHSNRDSSFTSANCKLVRVLARVIPAPDLVLLALLYSHPVASWRHWLYQAPFGLSLVLAEPLLNAPWPTPDPPLVHLWFRTRVALSSHTLVLILMVFSRLRAQTSCCARIHCFTRPCLLPPPRTSHTPTSEPPSTAPGLCSCLLRLPGPHRQFRMKNLYSYTTSIIIT